MKRAVVVVLVLLAGCSSSTDKPEPAAKPKCVKVTNPTLTALPGVTTAFPAGDRWYVSNPDGATWLTKADPGGTDGSLTLPMNDQARAASEQGVDVKPDAPIYDGHTDSEAAANQSRDCAS